MMSSMRVIRRWIESRSIGVMNVLCNASTQRCVIVSVSCSMSEIRRHFAAMFAPVVSRFRTYGVELSLGAQQYAAFTKAIKASTATWKVVVNEVPIQQYYALPYDRWEGYEAEREKLLHLADELHQRVIG